MADYQTPWPSGRTPYLAVPLYDGAAKDTVLDSTGRHRGIHSTDSGMAMSLMHRKGQIKSAPDVGHELHRITDLSGPNLSEQIRNAVENSYPLSRLVAEGRARIEKISHTVTRDRLMVSVEYTNTDTGERKPVGWYT